MKRPLRLGLFPLALALAGTLRSADEPAPAPTPATADVSSLKSDNKQLTDELAAAWKEADKLKSQLAAAQDASTKSSAEAADLQKQLDAAKAQPPAPTGDAASQLADTQDKLATALRSFSVVQDENAQLKATIDKLTADNAALSQKVEESKNAIATLQVQAAATSQIEPLRAQLRATQDESGRLAIENSQLRKRMALQGAAPGSKPVPTRPDQAPSPAALAASAAPAAAAAAAAAPAPRTYVVVEGDTLTRISRKFYGTSGRWEDILKANHAVLKDEKSLVVGSTLTIP